MFDSLVVEYMTPDSTTFRVKGLADSTIYYWRVCAADSGGSGLYSMIWSFTTGSGRFDAPMLVWPMDFSMGIPTSPTFRWSRVPDAPSYILQISKSFDFDSVIVEQKVADSTTLRVRGLADSTTYYWRVAVADSGSTGPYSMIWRFMTGLGKFEAPVPVWPMNGSRGISTSPMLTWSRIPDAVMYQIQLSTSFDFDTLVVEYKVQDSTSFRVKGLADSTMYYWRVAAADSGGAGPYSMVWSFMTGAGRLEAPMLMWPMDGSMGISTNPMLSWSRVPDALFYRLEISKTFDFDTLRVDQKVRDSTSIRVAGLADSTRYYWRVSAIDSGGAGPVSIAWSFTTGIGRSEGPVLLRPLNGAIGVSTSPTLSWEKGSGTGIYQLQISTTADFAAIIVDQRGIGGTSYDARDLVNGKVYYWRVAVTEPAGMEVYSAVWSFTTIAFGAGPAAPSLLSPADGSTEISTRPMLTWREEPGAIAYHVQISASSDFSALVVDQDGVASASYEAGSLANGTVYYWRVSARDSIATGSFSAAWSFTTVAAGGGLSAPTLMSPPDGGSGVQTNPTFSWKAVEGATSYHLQVSVSPAFTAIIMEQAGIATTSHSIAGLEHGTLYYWRVHPSGPAGEGSFSATWSFTTVESAASLTPPTLISPAVGATGVSRSPTLSWSSVQGAAWYQLQVSTNAAFSTTVLDESAIGGTSYTVSGLAGGTVYYWRVSALNSGGNGPYSVTGRFTTTLASAVEIMVDEIPREFQLRQNYPNPFNPSTTIEYALPKAMSVSMAVYNTSGQLVSVLVDGYRYPGTYRIQWKADVPSGVYFYRLQAGSFVAAKKMVLIR
jgi:hypothetical protein